MTGAAIARLPIDDVLPSLVAAVREHGVAVLVAPPGAGKTTRVPAALLDAAMGTGDIMCLQPRRLAARLAAARVAQERGTALGAEVGYEVRFDRQVSPATRLRYVTEGIVTRRLLGDPSLAGTTCLVIDELHERHLDGDLALALAARLRAGPRPDLRIVAMSATLDAEPIANFLRAPIIRSEGRAYPVDIEYAPTQDNDADRGIVAAIRRLLVDRIDGHILVFLPGAGEIRRIGDKLSDVATTFDVEVLPLHGELSPQEQDRAVARSSRRKVILATNVAETSVTIDGVAAVIDAGTARIARHSPWTGLPQLQLEPISRASAAQRAGRAGRTRAGRCIRLYTQHDHDGRRPFDVAEIGRADLAQTTLELAAAGIAVSELRWLEAPPEAAQVAATELLLRLGAVTAPTMSTGDAEARTPLLTPLGERMLRFPAHPRLARILCEAESRGCAREAAVAVAALSAREIQTERRSRAAASHSSASDVIDDVDALLAARARGMKDQALRSLGLEPNAARMVDRAARQLERLCQAGSQPRTGPRAESRAAADVDQALLLAILTGFPDRVGRRRSPGSREVVFAGGGSGSLAPSSAVISAELMVVVDATHTGTRGTGTRGVNIRRASAIDPAWLLDLYLDRIDDRDDLTWNASTERVERCRRLIYDGLTIDETLGAGIGDRADEAAALVARAAVAAGIGRFVDGDKLAEFRARVNFAAAHAPGNAITTLSDNDLTEVLASACLGLSSFAELRRVDLLALLRAALGPDQALIDRLAPQHLALPRRGRTPIHYESDRPPWIASRMQDFFGLPRAPAVADGKVPLVLHLLAPNQRPVQVTQDLPGFWRNHYPALRRELMRKYPRHFWPEDPTQLITE